MSKKLYVALLSLMALLAMGTAQAEVARSVITSGVVEREPVDDLQAVSGDTQRVIFFTEIRNMAGKRVSHVWMHNDEVMAEVKFEIGGPRWRVWSSKNMVPEWAGDWSVSVVDEWGNTLAEKGFSYAAPMQEMTGESSGEAMAAEPAAQMPQGE